MSVISAYIALTLL